MILLKRDLQKLKGEIPKTEKHRDELESELRTLNRKLKTKGYQKSTKKKGYYAYMDAGFKRFDTAEEATNARHTKVRISIERIESEILKLDLGEVSNNEQ